MFRLKLLIILFFTNLYSLDVLVVNKPISYESVINSSMVYQKDVKNTKKRCSPVTMLELNSNQYISTHYINRGSILCLKDIKLYQDNSVIFKFGSLEIEQKGKKIYENDKFIRIKKPNGKIEKIYKNGKN